MTRIDAAQLEVGGGGHTPLGLVGEPGVGHGQVPVALAQAQHPLHRRQPPVGPAVEQKRLGALRSYSG